MHNLNEILIPSLHVIRRRFIHCMDRNKKKNSIANIYERKILLPHSQNNAAFCCRREERRHYAGAKMPKKIIIQSNWWFV